MIRLNGGRPGCGCRPGKADPVWPGENPASETTTFPGLIQGFLRRNELSEPVHDFRLDAAPGLGRKHKLVGFRKLVLC